MFPKCLTRLFEVSREACFVSHSETRIIVEICSYSLKILALLGIYIYNDNLVTSDIRRFVACEIVIRYSFNIKLKSSKNSFQLENFYKIYQSEVEIFFLLFIHRLQVQVWRI